MSSASTVLFNSAKQRAKYIQHLHKVFTGPIRPPRLLVVDHHDFTQYTRDNIMDMYLYDKEYAFKPLYFYINQFEKCLEDNETHTFLDNLNYYHNICQNRNINMRYLSLLTPKVNELLNKGKLKEVSQF